MTRRRRRRLKRRERRRAAAERRRDSLPDSRQSLVFLALKVVVHVRANNKPYSKRTVALTNVNMSNSNGEQHSSVYSEKSNRLFARYSRAANIPLACSDLESRTLEEKTLANSPLKFRTKITSHSNVWHEKISHFRRLTRHYRRERRRGGSHRG